MKRFFVAIMCLVLLMGATIPAWAQTSRGRYTRRAPQYNGYHNPRRVNTERRFQDRSFWDRHRDKVTVAGGTAAGAALGGVTGGRKGAVIGALLGAGGSALYTYKLRDRDERRYYRR